MPEEIIIPVAKAHSDVDDETVTYILATRKHFEDLRQVAAQLAGLLVLAAVGALSMQRLGLNVTIYDPQVHYQQVRDAWIGVRTPMVLSASAFSISYT